MAGDAPVLKATGLSLSRAGRRVLEGVDLELRRGEVVALMGPNGVGKSTLLRCLAGLDRSDGGRLEIEGRAAAVLQDPALADRTAAANVESALRWWGVAREERRARAMAALERIGAAGVAQRRARSLSGGEARRVHIARGLALDSDVLLLDEPFAGLDAPVRGELLAQASTAIRDAGRATVIVVHDRAEAWALADRLVLIIDAGIAADGPLRQVMERPPTPAAARFLGFAGFLYRGDGSMLAVRPEHVRLDPAGELSGTVSRVIPEAQGVVCQCRLKGGEVSFKSDLPGPRRGDSVRIAITGGISFPKGTAA